MYLAHKNYKVANVPLVPEIPRPRLFVIFPEDNRSYGDPDKLNQIRRRLKTWDLMVAPTMPAWNGYCRNGVRRRPVQRLGCTVIDVSKKAVEER